MADDLPEGSNEGLGTALPQYGFVVYEILRKDAIFREAYKSYIIGKMKKENVDSKLNYVMDSLLDLYLSTAGLLAQHSTQYSNDTTYTTNILTLTKWMDDFQEFGTKLIHEQLLKVNTLFIDFFQRSRIKDLFLGSKKQDLGPPPGDAILQMN